MAIAGSVPPAALGLDLTFQGLVLSSTTGAVETSGRLLMKVRLAKPGK